MFIVLVQMYKIFNTISFALIVLHVGSKELKETKLIISGNYVSLKFSARLNALLVDC